MNQLTFLQELSRGMIVRQRGVDEDFVTAQWLRDAFDLRGYLKPGASNRTDGPDSETMFSVLGLSETGEERLSKLLSEGHVLAPHAKRSPRT